MDFPANPVMKTIDNVTRKNIIFNTQKKKILATINNGDFDESPTENQTRISTIRIFYAFIYLYSFFLRMKVNVTLVKLKVNRRNGALCTH